MTSPYLPWDRYTSEDRADHVLADLHDEPPAPFVAVPWPFRTAAEARASLRRQLRALRERLPCRPMRALTWDDEREMWELRRRHSGLMRLELGANASIKEMAQCL